MREIRLTGEGAVRVREASWRDFQGLRSEDYWCRVWPGGVGLAGYIGREFGAAGLSGKKVVDLGCGVGVVGIACAKLGGTVTFVDRVGDALALVKTNCRLNEITGFRAVLWDWNGPKPVLGQGAYDLVVGGDVLYDPTQWAGLSLTLARVLHPRGMALLADPGRIDRQGFCRVFREGGLAVRTTRLDVRWPPWASKTKQRTIDVYRLMRQENRSESCGRRK